MRISSLGSERGLASLQGVPLDHYNQLSHAERVKILESYPELKELRESVFGEILKEPPKIVAVRPNPYHRGSRCVLCGAFITGRCLEVQVNVAGQCIWAPPICLDREPCRFRAAVR